jgi:hypothetical protein
MKLVIIQYFQHRCVPFSSGANVLLSTLYPKTPSLYFTLKMRHYHSHTHTHESKKQHYNIGVSICTNLGNTPKTNYSVVKKTIISRFLVSRMNSLNNIRVFEVIFFSRSSPQRLEVFLLS